MLFSVAITGCLLLMGQQYPIQQKCDMLLMCKSELYLPLLNLRDALIRREKMELLSACVLSIIELLSVFESGCMLDPLLESVSVCMLDPLLEFESVCMLDPLLEFESVCILDPPLEFVSVCMLDPLLEFVSPSMLDPPLEPTSNSKLSLSESELFSMINLCCLN